MGTRGLNNEDLGQELEINSDLRLSNHILMKKSSSLGVVAPAVPFGSDPGSQEK